MKVKKARERLQRVNGLLTDILNGYTKGDAAVHHLLGRAQAAVSDAISRLDKNAATQPPANGSEASPSRPGVSGKKRTGKTTAKKGEVARVNGRSLSTIA